MPFLLNAGNFQLPAGGPVSGGTLTLTLSNPSATVIATGAAATAVYNITLDSNGNIPAGTIAYGNGELTPAGTFYTASLKTNGGVTVTLANNIWIVGPSAPYAGTLFPDVNVYPPLSISGIVPGALEFAGNSGLPAGTSGQLWIAGNYGTPIIGKIYLGDGTGWELDLAKRISSTDTTLTKLKDNGQVLLSDGASGTPTVSFINETNTGFYRSGTNEVSLTVGGTQRVKLGAGSVTIIGGSPFLTLSGTGSVFFGNPLDTNLSRTAAATLAVGNGTAGDTSGTVNAGKIAAGSAFTPSAAIHSKTASGSSDLILEQTVDANMTINLKNTVQSWNFGIRQSASEACIPAMQQALMTVSQFLLAQA